MPTVTVARWSSAVPRCRGGVREAHGIHCSARRGRGTPVDGRLCLGSETLGDAQRRLRRSGARRPAADRAAPRAGAGRRDRPRPRAAALERLPPARRCCAGRASSPTCPRSAATAWASAAFELGSAYTRQEPLQRIARPVLARLVDSDHAQRPPRRAARPRRALRRRGARGGAPAAGHRRRRAAAGPPDRQRPGDARGPAAGPGPGAVPLPRRVRAAPRRRPRVAAGPAPGAHAGAPRRLRARGRLGHTRDSRRWPPPCWTTPATPSPASRSPTRCTRWPRPTAGRWPTRVSGRRRRALPADPRPARAAASVTCPEAVERARRAPPRVGAMKAITIPVPGDADALVLAEVPAPEPGPDRRPRDRRRRRGQPRRPDAAPGLLRPAAGRLGLPRAWR